MTTNQLSNLLEFYLFLVQNIRDGGATKIISAYFRYIGLMPEVNKALTLDADTLKFVKMCKLGTIETDIYSSILAFYNDVKIVEITEIVGSFQRNIGSLEIIKDNHHFIPQKVKEILNKNPKMLEIFTKINN
jgi:hypothetical protein